MSDSDDSDYYKDDARDGDGTIKSGTIWKKGRVLWTERFACVKKGHLFYGPREVLTAFRGTLGLRSIPLLQANVHLEDDFRSALTFVVDSEACDELSNFKGDNDEETLEWFHCLSQEATAANVPYLSDFFYQVVGSAVRDRYKITTAFRLDSGSLETYFAALQPRLHFPYRDFHLSVTEACAAIDHLEFFHLFSPDSIYRFPVAPRQVTFSLLTKASFRKTHPGEDCAVVAWETGGYVSVTFCFDSSEDGIPWAHISNASQHLLAKNGLSYLIFSMPVTLYSNVARMFRAFLDVHMNPNSFLPPSAALTAIAAAPSPPPSPLHGSGARQLALASFLESFFKQNANILRSRLTEWGFACSVHLAELFDPTSDRFLGNPLPFVRLIQPQDAPSRNSLGSSGTSSGELPPLTLELTGQSPWRCLSVVVRLQDSVEQQSQDAVAGFAPPLMDALKHVLSREFPFHFAQGCSQLFGIPKPSASLDTTRISPFLRIPFNFEAVRNSLLSVLDPLLETKYDLNTFLARPPPLASLRPLLPDFSVFSPFDPGSVFHSLSDVHFVLVPSAELGPRAVVEGWGSDYSDSGAPELLDVVLEIPVDCPQMRVRWETVNEVLLDFLKPNAVRKLRHDVSLAFTASVAHALSSTPTAPTATSDQLSLEGASPPPLPLPKLTPPRVKLDVESCKKLLGFLDPANKGKGWDPLYIMLLTSHVRLAKEIAKVLSSGTVDVREIIVTVVGGKSPSRPRMDSTTLHLPLPVIVSTATLSAQFGIERPNLYVDWLTVRSRLSRLFGRPRPQLPPRAPKPKWEGRRSMPKRRDQQKQEMGLQIPGSASF